MFVGGGSWKCVQNIIDMMERNRRKRVEMSKLRVYERQQYLLLGLWSITANDYRRGINQIRAEEKDSITFIKGYAGAWKVKTRC